MSETTTVTILFTDIVSSTELLHVVGDDEARHLFAAHRELVVDAARVHGGRVVKWLGDGLMAVFPSAAEGVRAGVAIQQAARFAGPQMPIRVGINTGDALPDGVDYVGTAVVVARRLCDKADAGQILCADLVAGLLRGRRGFDFSELGDIELKGIPDGVRAVQVNYEPATGVERLARTPFVGRDREMERLKDRWRQASAGQGGLVAVLGEPGIGKSRLAQELTARVKRGDGLVAWGQCVEGGWAPAYGPFAEVVESLVREALPHQLREDLPSTAGALRSLNPGLRDALPDLGDVEPLPLDEERHRIFDAVTRLLVAQSIRAPLLVVLDDLHWADRETVAMLRHIGRFLAESRLLIVAIYRDTDVRPGHPLTDALGQLRRETRYDRVRLEGLATVAVEGLLSALAEHEVPYPLVEVIASETGGNPFFIREVLLHLIEERRIFRGDDGIWTSKLSIEEMGIPEGVKDVVNRRLRRLGEEATKFLTVASAFGGGFRFDVAARVSEIEESAALCLLDEALDAQIVRSAGEPETYEFTHALVRQIVFEDLNPSRKVRLHRSIAEALEMVLGANATPRQHAEMAHQYHRSSVLGGADQGVEHALVAAEAAESTGAHDEAVRWLRLALELLRAEDKRRPRLKARLGMTLAWALDYEESRDVSLEAARELAVAEGLSAAAEFLVGAIECLIEAGSTSFIFALAEAGLEYTGDRRDVVWAHLRSATLAAEEANDPLYMGIPLDTPARRQVTAIMRGASLAKPPRLGMVSAPGALSGRPHVGMALSKPTLRGPIDLVWESRSELDVAQEVDAAIGLHMLGDFESVLASHRAALQVNEIKGRIALAAWNHADCARALVPLGRLSEAREELARARQIAETLPESPSAGLTLLQIEMLACEDELCMATDEGWETIAAMFGMSRDSRIVAEDLASVALSSGLRDIRSAYLAAAGRIVARWSGTDEEVAREAISFLSYLLVPLERAPAWANNFNRVATDAAEILWFTGRTDNLSLIETALREKVVEPDFRYPMHDGRLSLARLCALTGRFEEAGRWFAEARRVLAEQKSEPMLAICDFDEAWMKARFPDSYEPDPAGVLLTEARRRFETIGMPGWEVRADALEAEIG